MKAKHILVSGKVQGVGYRNFVLNSALQLGVCGSVKNLRSGQVEVYAKAKASSLEDFIKNLRQGPLRSRVENLEINEVEAETVDFYDFVILL